MKDAGIHIKVITPEHPSTKDMLEDGKKLGYEIKTVPTSIYSAKVSLEAGDSFVRIILFDPPQAVIIESPELAESVRQIFQIVWKQIP